MNNVVVLNILTVYCTLLSWNSKIYISLYIFPHKKFHFPNSSWSSVSYIKSKEKEIFARQPCCYFILYKSVTSANGEYLSKIDSHITFHGLWYLVPVLHLSRKFANSPHTSYWGRKWTFTTLGVISNGIICTLNFVDAVIQSFNWNGHTLTHTHTKIMSKAAPPPPNFFFRVECRLKNCGVRLTEILWQCFSDV
jgi:hypothetical protein